MTAPIGEHILSECLKEAHQDHELWRSLCSVEHGKLLLWGVPWTKYLPMEKIKQVELKMILP